MSEVKPGELPWVGRDDLILMKAISASERHESTKRVRDMDDIIALLEEYPGPLMFPGSATAEANKRLTKRSLPFLASLSQRSEEEWLKQLGL